MVSTSKAKRPKRQQKQRDDKATSNIWATDFKEDVAKLSLCAVLPFLTEAGQGAVRTAGASSAKLSRNGRMGGDAWTESALPLCRCARLLRNAQRHTAGRRRRRCEQT